MPPAPLLDDLEEISESESLEVPFERPEDQTFGSRFHPRAGERRPLIAALLVSLFLHGALLVVAIIIINRHIHRAPAAALIRGDQGGDASDSFEAGPTVEPANFTPVTMAHADPPTMQEPPAPTPPPIDTAADAPSSLNPSPLPPTLAAVSPSGDHHPFGVTPSDGVISGAPLPARPGDGTASAPASAPPVINPPRVARGLGLGDTMGARGDPDGLDVRGLPIPEYPSESRHRGEEGLVELDVEVRADGTIGVVRISTGSGYARLDDAAVAAVKKASFEPATLDGKPIAAHVTVPYRFILRQASRL